MTEAASNAVLKMIEEPPPRTVVMLCAPSLHPDDVPVTIRSRCRVVGLRTPPVDAIADVLVRRDGVDPALAAWSAAAAGGHVGRARRLARDEDARLARKAVLDVPLSLVSLAACLDAADDLVGAAQEETDAGDRRPSTAPRPRRSRPASATAPAGRASPPPAGGAGQLKELERRQKSRATRLGRDSLDRALVDLAGPLPRRAGARLRPAARPADADAPRPPRRRRGTGPPDRCRGGAAPHRRHPGLPARRWSRTSSRGSRSRRSPWRCGCPPERVRALRRTGDGGVVGCPGTSAALAQSVEHLTRNEKVVGSIPTGGSPPTSGFVLRTGPLSRLRPERAPSTRRVRRRSARCRTRSPRGRAA